MNIARLHSMIFVIFCLWGGVVYYHFERPDLQETVLNAWQATKLKPAELEGFLRDEHCYLDQSRFTACALALKAMAREYQLVMHVHTGIFEPKDFRTLSAKDKRVRPQFLQKALKKIFMRNQLSEERFSFLNAWRWLLKEKIQKNEESYIISIGLNTLEASIHDPHTYLVPVKYFENTMMSPKEEEIGLGLSLRLINDRFVVSHVYPNSPAKKQNIQVGDEIVKINEQVISGLTVGRVQGLLIGNLGTEVTLSIRHQSKQSRQITLIRTRVKTPQVEARLLERAEGLVGLVTLRRFFPGSCGRVEKSVKSLIGEGAQGLIVDLRDNPGGPLDEAACIANLFVEKNKKLFEARYFSAENNIEVYSTEKDPIYQGPVATLVNYASASSAEALAGSLQDLGRAVVVGQRTFGKGSFQKGRLWEKNSRIAIFETQGLYFLPTGRTPQINGIAPDIEVKGELVGSREEDLYYNAIIPQLEEDTSLARFTFALACEVFNINQQSRQNSFMSGTQLESPLREATQAIKCLRNGVQAIL